MKNQALFQTFRGELKLHGCVSVAFPPFFNPRLANQQGLFLLNGAESLLFADSLAKMMEGEKDWCRALDIPVTKRPEIETRLFQMNISRAVIVSRSERVGWSY